MVHVQKKCIKRFRYVMYSVFIHGHVLTEFKSRFGGGGGGGGGVLECFHLRLRY